MSKISNNKSHSGDNQTKDRPPSTPRWVKVSGIIIITLILLFIIIKFTGIGGNHGPGRHFRGGEALEFDNPRFQTLSSIYKIPRGEYS